MSKLPIVIRRETPLTRTVCDDCHRDVTGIEVNAYGYRDLPGPEYVCDDCKPAHDREDSRQAMRELLGGGA